MEMNNSGGFKEAKLLNLVRPVFDPFFQRKDRCCFLPFSFVNFERNRFLPEESLS